MLGSFTSSSHMSRVGILFERVEIGAAAQEVGYNHHSPAKCRFNETGIHHMLLRVLPGPSEILCCAPAMLEIDSGWQSADDCLDISGGAGREKGCDLRVHVIARGAPLPGLGKLLRLLS